MQGCHRTIYNGTFFSERDDHCHSFDSFESESSHHSLVLEDSSKISYSCEPNIIQLLVTEASASFPAVTEVSLGSRMEDKGSSEGCESNSEGRKIAVQVQVRVECADDEEASAATDKLTRLGGSQNLLRPSAHYSSPGSSIGSDSVGSPTPTPSFVGQTSWASSEKTVEDTRPPVRGEEVALLEEEVHEAVKEPGKHVYLLGMGKCAGVSCED